MMRGQLTTRAHPQRQMRSEFGALRAVTARVLSTRCTLKCSVNVLFNQGRLAMSISFEDSTESLRHIRLSGRLDIPGIDAVSATFAELSASTRRRIVVDLSGVDFLVS